MLPTTTSTTLKTTTFPKKQPKISAKLQAVEGETAETEVKDEIELLLTEDSDSHLDSKSVNKQSSSGAISVSHGIRLVHVSMRYQGVTVLKDV